MNPQDKEAFEELLANCADEPIRFPGAIQPHGLLLTLSEPDLSIIQISANVETLLARPAQELIGQPLQSLIGDAHAAQVREALQQAALSDAPPLHFRLNGTAFEGLLHRHQDVLILELEIHVENFQPRNVAGTETHLGRMLARLQKAQSLQALYDISVKEIQAMTGYDRVLIYRFEEEGHGQVIAEASDPSMEVFNGLFFPASDIPEQARELYRTNWLRIIPNADYQPVPLVPKLRPDTQTPLDLSFATLRSVSPIHCQYMKNMGVLSSMSISLLKGDKLWGLISCGNRQPLHVPHELRTACQTIGQVLSLQISAMEALEVSRQREEKLEALALLNQAMIDSPQNVFDGLANQPQVLMALANAGGIAIIEDKQLHRYGNCPEPEEIRALHKWLQERGEPVFASHHLASVYPPAAHYQQVASGVLAMSLPKPVDNGVLWFRPEVKENINWSGDPRKPLDLENSDAGLRLRPRTSFEIWKVEMAGISTKWSHGDLFAANDLRRSALENDLARQVRREQEAVRARDELVAVVSHDLRNPMTVISMLCGMMQKAFSSDGPHTSRRISTAIDTMQQAAGRMNTLLEDLLDTSKIDAGRYTIAPQKLDVAQMFEEAQSLLAPLALDKDISISFEADPDLSIHADPERLFQVLSNLVGNAIKFTPRLGTVDVYAKSVGDDIVFTVRDSGEGIPKDHLPHVFDRYWTVKEGNPTGTGLGLYITQGIVEAHGGQIVAESEPGQGSEFRFTVPRLD
ncbi:MULTISPECIES: ATP-binding protein [Pseudomonas]|uniref:histidine kinase n=2 Tax=Pseudomonas fluorescens TaxID=294 RepID=Q8VRN8_PSEFL|nr:MULTISPECIES: ATP-binding protein [Pseudomonas]AAL50631.1 bacteriophytochrome [Pseudomonas fluorescens]ABA73905.1 multi-sensor signal transduction histidine kinase [Pseudomonas fluorescens Pf0-1]MBL0795200.1 GAF domain-containing protein [Pseudomonas sp. B7]MBX8624522.1 GAF domain-containing protein [Pseudomonas glycinae]MBY9027271.1 GAF domain-containing protein [Pseudomonas fluorescens]